MTRERNAILRSADRLARGVGWLSIGLGITDVVLGGRIARGLGLNGKAWLARAAGAREIANGAAILLAEDPTPWVWGRIAADGFDLAVIARGMAPDGRKRLNSAIGFGLVAGVTALDVVCVLGLEQRQRRIKHPDYSRHSGFPKGVEASRGIASDFVTPADMRGPEAMRPWTEQRSSSPVPQQVQPLPARSA